nr:ATP phosphoribosyltransferase 1, chloroplastic [Tanacetum cinerariifolium]
MSSSDSTVTYTFILSEDLPFRGICFFGMEQPDSPEAALQSPIQILPVPQDEDEREPMFIQPHDPDYVPEPVYPEYIPLEDEHVLSAEEQPLPPVTKDGPVDYPMDGGDYGDDDNDESSGDNTNDEDEDEEEGEEHFPVIPPPSTDTTITGARIIVRLQAAISLPPEAEVERLLAMPTPPPSPLASLSPPSVRERLARLASTQALSDAVTTTLPSPPLPLPLYIPPPVYRRDDIPETEMPPRKRLYLSTLGSRYEIRESYTARPTRGQGIDYGFVSTLDAKARRRGIKEVGYGIRDTWVDPAEIVPKIAPMTVGEWGSGVDGGEAGGVAATAAYQWRLPGGGCLAAAGGLRCGGGAWREVTYWIGGDVVVDDSGEGAAVVVFWWRGGMVVASAVVVAVGYGGSGGGGAGGYKWIFKKKMKSDGTIDKYKARLVIIGFRQCEGQDYFDTYSLVTRITSIRMVLVMAALRNLEVHQMDVKTEFLNGELKVEIYMNQPKGFIALGQESKVCRLVKSLYGLKQAPNQWHQKFDHTMLESGFKINECDKCVYVKDTSSGYVIMCLYVDDMLIIGSNDKMIKSTKDILKSKFDMKDMGLANVIRGIKIIQTHNGLVLSQAHYVEKILNTHNAWDSGLARTPIDTSTRPDLACAVNKLSRYTSNPSDAHWKAMTRASLSGPTVQQLWTLYPGNKR